MANNLGDMTVRIIGDSTSLDKSLDKSKKELDGLGTTGTKTSKTLATAGRLIQTAFVAAIVAGVAKIGKELISVASDAEEIRNKFNVTFSSISDAANTAATDLADGFGLSQVAAEDLLSTTGDLLSGFGFTQTAALDLATQTNELAADLASFANVPVKQASDAITKGLLGERESMKLLGIAILEADINQLAEDKGIVGELDRQQKAMLTLELAVKQSKNAIGDFARSQDSFANQSKIAKAATEDLQVELGKNLLPIATRAVSLFGDLTKKLSEYVAERNNLVAAETALKDGNATLEDRILLQENELDNLNDKLISEVNALATAKSLNGAYGVRTDLIENNIKSTQEEIRLAAETVRALAKQKYWTDQNTIAAKENEAAVTESEEKTKEAAEDAAIALQAQIDKSGELAGQIRNDLIGNALVPMTTAEMEMWRAYGEGAISAVIATESVKTVLEETGLAALDFTQTFTDGLAGTLSSFEDLGAALVNGEDGFTAFGKAALGSLAGVLRAIGDQLAAMSALALVSAIMGKVTDVPAIVAGAAGASAAYIAAGAIEAKAASFAEGGIVMPTPGGTFAQVAEAGQPEIIFPLDKLESFMKNSGGGGGGNQQFHLYIDGKEITTRVVKNINNGIGGALK